MENDRMLIDKLRQEMLSGKTTYDDIVKRLTRAIESKYLKESPSIEFIDSCEDLLWKIETEGKQKFVSVSDRYLGAIEQHVEISAQDQMKRSPAMGFAKCIALISAAFAILIFFTRGAIHFEWFTQHSSTDEQQYIIQGHDIDIDIISKSIAEHNEYDMLQTTAWDEFIDFLGFVPSIVKPEVLDALETQYIAFIEPGVIMLYVQYTNAEKGIEVLMTIQYFTNMNDAYFVMEQDTKGTEKNIANQSVYVSTNLDNQSFMWLDENAVYWLSGTFEADSGFTIIRELLGGYCDEN